MAPQFDESGADPLGGDSIWNDEIACLLADSVFHDGESSTAPDVESDSLTAAFSDHRLGRIDHYVLTSVLGSGGMGIVFRAFDSADESEVCVKLMSHTLKDKKTARLRFEREASMMLLVRHHNVVRLLGQGSIRLESGTSLPWLAMSLAPGRPLDRILKQEGRFAENRILWIGKELTRGLAAIHEAGIVHRDLKPANLIVEERTRRLSIIDFGLARPLRNSSMITRSDQLLGTPAYMSPEQFKGAPLDQRTDLYSVGVLLYTMAAGIPPFVANDWSALRNRVMTGKAEPVDSLRPELSPGLRELIHTLLEKNPARRLASAVAVVRALESIGPEIERGPVDPSAWCHAILADDDEHFGRAAIHRMKLKGVAMRQALTPFELFRMMSEKPPPDVILVDIAYGEHDGIDIVRQLREERPEIPILVMTSARSIDKAVAAMKLGCKDFLCKPLEDENLARVLREAVVPVKRPES